MKRNFILILFLFVTLASFARFGNSDNGSVNLSGNQTVSGVKTFFSSPIIPTPTNASQAVTKAYADDLAGNSTLRYYFQESADPVIAGYESFATAPLVVQTTEVLGTINTSITHLETNITPVNTPNLTTFISGIYEVKDYFSKSGSGDVTLVYGLWLRTVGGVERQIATSSTQVLSGVLGATAVNVQFSVAVATSAASTDRIVTKLYATRNGTAGLTRYYGDGTSSYFGVPISPRNFTRTDGSNIGTDFLANINVYSKTAGDARYSAINGSTTQDFNAQNLKPLGNIVGQGAAYLDFYLNSTDGSDSKCLRLGGGGDVDVTRGAFISLYGNEFSGVSGDMNLWAGLTSGVINFKTNALTRTTIDASGNASFSGDVRANSFTLGGNLLTSGKWLSGDGGNEGIQINSAGEIQIATTTDAGDYKLQVAGQSIVQGMSEIKMKGSDGNRFLRFNDTSIGGKAFDLMNYAGNLPGDFGIFDVGSNSTRVILKSNGNILIATGTDHGEALQVAGNIYTTGTCSALAFEDRSAFPDSVSDAYEIINSHEGANGKLDHSKLSSKAWGTKSVQVGTVQKQITTQETKKIVEDGKEKEVVEDVVKTVNEPVYESQPDQSKRNLSMTISALCEVVKDQQKQIEELKKKLP